MTDMTKAVDQAPSDLVIALAEAVGVELGYHDIYGTRHEASADTLRRLLEALGFAAATADDARAGLDRLRAERWSRAVPPITVLRRGAPSVVSVVLPREALAAPLPWRLVLEDGAALTGEAPAGALTEEEASESAEVTLVRAVLPLPDDLPLGYHRLDIGPDGAAPDPELHGVVAVAPAACYLPPAVADGGRVWGIGCQLYALRSADNWGMGDFRDLARLGVETGRRGGATVGLNPLHALFPNKPADASPYSPNSRLFLNALYISLPDVPEFAACAAAQARLAAPETVERLAAARAARHVDYPLVARLKRPILDMLFDTFEAAAPAERKAAFESFLAEGGARLHRFAVFQTLQETYPDLPWPSWPDGLDDSTSPAVDAFAKSRARAVRKHLWMQFEADRQLGAASKALEEAGGSVGLYRDLAVGVNPDGADAWMDPDAYVRTARFGAPPDDLGPLGQDWGLPPLNPHALRNSAYGPFIDMLRANMRHAGALRIDHAMALRHLFWIPPGKQAVDGVYVAYPMDDLLGILALESHRNRCLIIGEDLGTVPDGFRERMEAENILSYRVLYFERYASGLFKRPEVYPVQALATATSHDMATIPGNWRGWDIALRHNLGLTQADQDEAADMAARADDRAGLVAALADQGLLPSDFPRDTELSPSRLRALTLACHRFLARAPSQVMLVNIDDLAGEVSQVNVPGTVSEYPNWSRRLSVPLEDLTTGAAMEETAAALCRDRA